jgi:hypothetical protein
MNPSRSTIANGRRVADDLTIWDYASVPSDAEEAR